MRALLPADTREKNLRAMRFLVGALIGGLIVFALMVWLLRPDPEPDDGVEGVFVAVATALTVGGWVAGWGLRRFHVARLGRMTSADERDRLAAFFQVTFIRSALAEGPGLLFLVTVLITGGAAGMVGAAACGALLASYLPTDSAFERFSAAAGGAGVEPQ